METNPAVAALREVLAQRHGSFAILTVDGERNYYAQFAADETPGVYAEIVGNEYLRPADQLSTLQQAEMRARGWEGDGSANWSRQWPDPLGEDDLQRIVYETLNDLHEVYGADGDLQIETTLEGVAADESVAGGEVEGPAPEGRSRAIVAMVVAFLALLAAVVLSVFAGCSLASEAATEVLYVDAETVECVGEGVQQCLIVRRAPDGARELFYDGIEGFEHEPGVRFVIEVEVRAVATPPADGSSLAYRLVRVIERSPV